MKKCVTTLGDYFFYGFAVLSVLAIMASVATPARGLLLDEFSRLLDHKGKVRSLAEFDKKLEYAGISRADFVPEIRIVKRSREMRVFSNSKLVATYPIGLGRATIGTKQNATDQKTPEGMYYVCDKDENNRYHLFLQINYPSGIDAERALVQDVIKNSEYEILVGAWQNKITPPVNTGLGGPLGIHGFGAESSWTTDGSISMHNVHVEELFWNVEKGTPVAILP
jgi:murein L,D-transpeptidase YafK